MSTRKSVYIALGLFTLLCTALFPLEVVENRELSGFLGFLHLSGGTLLLPGRTFELLKASPSAGSYGWILAIGYSTLYAQTALILGLRNARPALKPFLPIPEERYYLAQSGFTVPVGTAAMGIGFGVSFGLSRAMGSDVEPGPLWAAFNAAMVLPTVITMWLPETIGGLFAKTPTGFMPPWLDNWRQIVGLGWIVAVNCIASSVVAGLPWWQSIIVGTLSTAATGGVMIAFLR
jgi:hypothetical protein